MSEQIGVIGAGTMGQGIAQVLAQSGFTVSLFDIASEPLERALEAIDRSLARLVDKVLVWRISIPHR